MGYRVKKIYRTTMKALEAGHNQTMRNPDITRGDAQDREQWMVIMSERRNWLFLAGGKNLCFILLILCNDAHGIEKLLLKTEVS